MYRGMNFKCTVPTLSEQSLVCVANLHTPFTPEGKKEKCMHLETFPINHQKKRITL